MDQSRKNRRDFSSIVSETYRDFAENTSIHGLKYTVKSDIAKYEKFFWLLVVLAGLGGSGYMTKLFWDRYMSNPTRTSIKTAFAPTSSIPFPAVTVCNINRVLDSKVKNFTKILDVNEDEKELVENTLPQLIAFTTPSAISYNYSDLDKLDEILKRNDFDTRFVMRKISPSCRDMLIVCGWNFSTIPCMELFQESLSLQGFCCSFNYIAFERSTHMKYNLYSGLNSGLRIVIDPLIEEKQYLSLHSSGVEIYVHHPLDYPGMGSISKIVSNGREIIMEIAASKLTCSEEVKRLPIVQRQCVYPEERYLTNFKTYADTNCLTECDAQHFYKKCKCVPYHLAFPNRNVPVCNATNIQCLNSARKTSVSEILGRCNCPPQCEDDFYNVMSASTGLRPEVAAMTTSAFLPSNLLNNNTILVQVYFSGQRQTILYRDVITSTIYLLSSFGGVYSLFLGCSFITLVEIIYYCTLRFVVNLKIFGQIEKEPKHKRNRDNKKPEKNIKQHREDNKMKLWQYEGNIFLN